MPTALKYLLLAASLGPLMAGCGPSEKPEAQTGVTSSTSGLIDVAATKIKGLFSGKNPMSHDYIGNSIEYFERELKVQPKRQVTVADATEHRPRYVGRVYELGGCEYWVIADEPDKQVDSISVHPNQDCKVRVVDKRNDDEILFDSNTDTFFKLKGRYPVMSIYADCIYCGNWGMAQYYALRTGQGPGISFGFDNEDNEGIENWRGLLLEKTGHWQARDDRMEELNPHIYPDETEAALKMWSDLPPTSVTIFQGHLWDVPAQHIHPE